VEEVVEEDVVLLEASKLTVTLVAVVAVSVASVVPVSRSVIPFS
jgi:hypothetical protein